MEGTMSALTLRLPDSLEQDIRDLAERQQMTRSDFARRALESYVKQTQQTLALQAMIEAAQAIQHSPQLQQHIAEMTSEFSPTEADLALSVAEDEADNASAGWWK
jgi:predicted transcriptional regulator